jgi:hypothetical protein
MGFIPSKERPMSQVASWEAYLAGLCVDAWSLDPSSTIQIVKNIEALVAPGAANASTVATVLQRAGVAEVEAGSFAPGICAAIAA